MNTRTIGAGAACVGLLAACATPSTQGPVIAKGDVAVERQAEAAYVVKARLAEQARVARVADRLMEANADICPARAAHLGLSSATIHDFPSAFRPAAKDALSLGDAPTVLYVEPGGPAELAGLRIGDVLAEVGNHAVETGPTAGRALRTQLKAVAHAGAPLPIVVTRGGERLRLSATPRLACDYPVRVDEAGEPNAYADGQGVAVTRGLLKIAATDEELAVVVGHEMAHNVEHHIGAQRRNAALGMAGGLTLDILAAAAGVNTGGAFAKAAGQAGQGYASARFEAEADYVGLYYVARAGFDIGHAEDFWRKMSVEAPRSIFVTSSHPANAQRYLALAATRAEIEAKRSHQLALAPNRRGGPAAKADDAGATATALAAAP